MSANVQESTAVREGKTYGYQGQRESTATAAATDTGLEQQKQRLMTDIEAFLDSLVMRVGGGAEGGGAPATTPSGGGTGTPATGTPATGTPATGTPASGTTTSGAPTTGTSSTGAPTTGTASTGTPATGAPTSGTTTTTAGGAPATGTGAAPRPGEQPGAESTAANREALEKSIFVQREAYRIDKEREQARKAKRESAAKATAAPAAPTVAEAASLKHRSDSNRAPLVESREFAPAFGEKGRGQAMTMERMSIATSVAQRPETVPLPGAVTGRPIDAYWASYGTAIERAAVRAQADRQTNVILETIIGTDDRVKVTNNQAYPWRCICSLLITAQSGTQYIGTGWLVAPRVVLTAGHCVYMADEGGWATQIEVMPGRNGADRPYGTAICRDLRSVTGWTQDNDSDCDYGAILLPADKRYGDQLGWFGYAVRDDDYLRQVTLNLSGYPGDGGRTAEDGTQWFMSRAVKDVMARQISYEIDTYGGQSGSPVWEMTSNGNRYGVGIHTYGTSVSNGATRIVSEVFQNIVGWAGEAP